MRVLRWLLAATLAVFLPVSAEGPLLVQFDEENPPFMYAAPAGSSQAAGIYPAIIREAFMRMKVEVDLQAVPWKKATGDADASKAGIGGIYKNDERIKKYDYSNPIFTERLLAYSSKSKKLAALKDGMTVAVIAGWSYGNAFDAARKAGKYKIIEGNDLSNFEALDKGTADVALAAPETAEIVLKDRLARDFTAMATPLTVNQTFLIFPKGMGKTTLITQFNKVLDSMKADGTIRRIVQAELAK